MPAPSVQPAVMNKLVDQLAVLVSPRAGKAAISRRPASNDRLRGGKEGRGTLLLGWGAAGYRAALARAHPRDKQYVDVRSVEDGG